MKAEAFWRFCNFAETRAAERGRALLRVNIDETAVTLYPGRQRGAVAIDDRIHSPKRALRCVQAGSGAMFLSEVSDMVNAILGLSLQETCARRAGAEGAALEAPLQHDARGRLLRTPRRACSAAAILAWEREDAASTFAHGVAAAVPTPGDA